MVEQRADSEVSSRKKPKECRLGNGRAARLRKERKDCGWTGFVRVLWAQILWVIENVSTACSSSVCMWLSSLPRTNWTKRGGVGRLGRGECSPRELDSLTARMLRSASCCCCMLGWLALVLSRCLGLTWFWLARTRCSVNVLRGCYFDSAGIRRSILDGGDAPARAPAKLKRTLLWLTQEDVNCRGKINLRPGCEN